MKKILKFTALSAVLLMLAGLMTSCDERESCIPFITIAQGDNSPICQQNTVIRTQKEWEEFIMPFTSPISLANPFSETEVDFSTYTVIAVVDEVRPVVQWGMRITCIQEYIGVSAEDFGRTVVYVTVFSPRDGITSPMLVQNWHVIKMPISKKSIEFDVRIR